MTSASGMSSAVHTNASIFTVNAGSSTIKFALFQVGQPLARVSSGKIERIGLGDGVMTVTDHSSGRTERLTVQCPDHAACVEPLVGLLERHLDVRRLQAIGHRVVHGGTRYTRPQSITADVLKELRRLSPYDPEHLPGEISLIEGFSRRYPTVPQVACFDTAFHRDMPRVARLLAIPRRYDADGVQRYGFHGLSYAYLMDELARVAGREAADGRVILAHLGNGASLAAVLAGKSVDTTMAFTPTAGLPMSTRSGDLDPGLVSYLARTDGMTVEQFHEMVNTKSGLLGISEISPDLRDLLAHESDVRAAEAVAFFCYQTKKWIGAFAAALGGLDTLVFSGGIGENSAVIRARICDGLGFLGLMLDEARNAAGDPIISQDKSEVTVRVIRTDEEIQIANSVSQLLAVQGERP
ncbi:MAG TPA: acetate/propionate family kinase [Nitrospirales bacterium]|jgi:acetate kinase|nr:acetate/propionate family kinase [Nitrospirales bacterium]